MALCFQSNIAVEDELFLTICSVKRLAQRRATFQDASRLKSPESLSENVSRLISPDGNYFICAGLPFWLFRLWSPCPSAGRNNTVHA
ncbi:Hypothetical protein NTJ_01494 [Nesidiocoris tenuis]|uniref:Uncharacterized protein n=1 Tax=Nesidiocoris tenuis TaxID=355587 RepID=A0ABN7AEI7_9HEMI|nr:Hypothetical protein NTJ_01494 [Nesidiocoris tenuis]